MNYIVALTGGIGSGKTTIANIFEQLGVTIIDADVIARRIVEKGTPTLEAISQKFGSTILLTDGSLNRTLLRETIFSSQKARIWLNGLLHPLIQQETLHQFANSISPYILWVIPLLIENKLTVLVDRILVIDVDPKVQFKRVLLRDGSSHNVLKDIIRSQVSREERLSYADDIIDNDTDLAKTFSMVAKLHQRYLRLAIEKSDLNIT